MSNFHDLILPSCTDGLLAFQSVSDLDSIPNLRDYDIDEQLPTSIQSQYYSVSELASLETKSQDLSILHTNVRSLSCHHDDLISLLGASNESFDVMGVSEIWHSEKRPIITNVDIDGYTFYSTKSLSQNGGVGLNVKSSINCTKRVDLNHQCDDFGTIWIETEILNDKNLLFCCAYRHPNSPISTSTDHLTVALTRLNNKRVFIMGDFNIDLLNYDTHFPTKGFINSFLSNHFLPCINYPTRISDCSSTIIDNIFTNIVDAQLICGNITTHISDHFPQFLILKHAKIPHLQTRTLKYDYSSFNERNLLKDFNEFSLNYINDASDIDTNYDKFLSDSTLLVKKHVPSRMTTKRELKFKSKPWISYRIQKMIKLRDRFLRRLTHNKSENNLVVYKKFRNRVANELKAARKKYFQNYFQENGKNMKKIWTGIKRILSNKNSIFSRIYKIKDKNGKLTSDAAEMSIILNESFINVGNDISKSI